MSIDAFKEFDPSVWVTQAEAARLRGVSRQAIHKLVQKGHLSTVEIGGIIFVKRSEVELYVPQEPGRPYGTHYTEVVKQILALLEQCSPQEKRIVLQNLRKELQIHEIEEKLNIQAEVILEAIDKDASGLTFRMLRGVIAESAFKIHVLDSLQTWVDATPIGDKPYDFLLSKDGRHLRIQIKLQRSKNQQAMFAHEALHHFPKDKYVVETQKTRAGVDTHTGKSTRLYRYDEFDILAVSMQPCTYDWARFVYIPVRWLLHDPKESDRILKFQPVSLSADEFWTDSFEEAVRRFLSDSHKTLQYNP